MKGSMLHTAEGGGIGGDREGTLGKRDMGLMEETCIKGNLDPRLRPQGEWKQREDRNRGWEHKDRHPLHGADRQKRHQKK